MLKTPCNKPVLLILLLFLVTACKKESQTLPAKPVKSAVLYKAADKAVPKNNSLSTYTRPVANTNVYPLNYLQLGNYWVYNCRTVTDDYFSGQSHGDLMFTDSVAVNGIKTGSHGDTLYRLTHYFTGNNYPTYAEYFLITSAGQLQNEWGATVYDFQWLPEVSDKNCQRKGCGNWYWEPGYFMDTVASCSTDCCVFDAAVYTLHGSRDVCQGPG